jgi:imidazolonepropionase-like amidohydrolase
MSARALSCLAPVAAVLAVCLVPGRAAGQTRAEDRKKTLDGRTPVSDDPRRVPVKPEPRGPEGTLVIRGGRIFDGTGAAPRPGTVVIERNRIKAVLPAESKDWPPEATVLDVTGETVLPGLIDIHTHLSYQNQGGDAEADDLSDAALRGAERLRFYVESGITSVRDVASQGTVPFRLKQWVAENRIPGPRVFAAGQLITGSGGHGVDGQLLSPPYHGSIRPASGPDDWREAVREQFTRGADVIKVASHFSKPEITAAVEEAHALGLRVTCDCENFYVDWAVDAGVDGIEHPLPRTEETIKKMARRSVVSDPTLVPYDIIFDDWGGYFGSTSRRFTFSKEANLEMLRRLRKAGVKTGVGTDLVLDWFRFLPEPYIRELRHLTEAGATPTEALVVATKTNADILDMADRLGTLEAGKLADVLTVRGKPESDLGDLKNVDVVVRDGYVVVRDGHVEIPRHVPKEMPAGR